MPPQKPLALIWPIDGSSSRCSSFGLWNPVQGWALLKTATTLPLRSCSLTCIVQNAIYIMEVGQQLFFLPFFPPPFLSPSFPPFLLPSLPSTMRGWLYKWKTTRPYGKMELWPRIPSNQPRKAACYPQIRSSGSQTTSDFSLSQSVQEAKQKPQ